MDTIMERIEKFNAPLLPEMVQLKYKAMKQNAFRFFRGTCHLFYEDLSQTKNFPPSPLSWISGDLHLENFGSYKGNNRLVYFDMNDFDESMLAPLNWELARVLTSIYVAFDVLKLKMPIADEMATLFLNKYRETLKSGKACSIDPRTAKGTVRLFLNNAKKRTEKELIKKITDASRKKLTIKIDNLLHFKLKPKLKEALLSQLTAWLKNTPSWPDEYTVKDAAFRVAGTGSIGLKRYMFLLQNRIDKDSFLLLELKEAKASSLSLYNKTIQPHWNTPAQRIITNKYRMQNVSPALLTTIRFKQASYVLQEMQPYDDKIRFELLGNKIKDLSAVLTDMAILTASAQLRSSGIQGSAINDELTAFAQRKQWQSALLAYAKKYADQVKADYKQFVSTMASD